MITLIRNIGALLSGRLASPIRRDTSLTIDEGFIVAIGDEPDQADLVINANHLTVIPGLIDGHVHPTFGDWTPAQNSIGWIQNYLHGGTTTMVSAGELHVPGLPLDDLDPQTVLNLALLSRRTTARAQLSRVKLEVGTVLLVPGLREADFDRMAEAGVRHAKFIFYDWQRAPSGEAQDYVRWARARDIVVKVHSGGVSRSGWSQPTGFEIIASLEPDIAAHVSGGPIPMPDEEILQVIETLPDVAVEICSSMNYRATVVAVQALSRLDRLDRLTLGTDTPGGTGVIPRGMLRNVCYLAAMCGLDPAAAVAAATGNVAAVHRLPSGILEVGRPADLLILGPIQGSAATDALESFALGDLPGISAVLIDGVPCVAPRSRQTPPPRRLVTVEERGR